jgi:hypothetical protein
VAGVNGDHSLTIGGFARLSGLSVEALRHYDAIGPCGRSASTGTRATASTRSQDIREVPAQRVLTVTDRAYVDEMSELVPRQIDEVRDYLREAGLRPAGPPVCICPFPDEDGMLRRCRIRPTT